MNWSGIEDDEKIMQYKYHKWQDGAGLKYRYLYRSSWMNNVCSHLAISIFMNFRKGTKMANNLLEMLINRKCSES